MIVWTEPARMWVTDAEGRKRFKRERKRERQWQEEMATEGKLLADLLQWATDWQIVTAKDWDAWHTVGVWCLWHNDNLNDDDDAEEDDGYYDKNSADVEVVVRLQDPRDGRRAGRRAGRQADRASWGNYSSQWVSLPVSQHTSFNRTGLQTEPLACNCMEGQGRPVYSLIRGKEGEAKKEEKSRAMLTTEINIGRFYKSYQQRGKWTKCLSLPERLYI